MTGGPAPTASENASAVFVQLADLLDPRYDVLDTMDLLVHTAVRFTAAVDAGIVLADADAALHMIATTSERTSDVEEVQLETQQGPCWDSYRSGQTVEAPTCVWRASVGLSSCCSLSSAASEPGMPYQ